MALGDLFGQDYMPVQPNSVANNPLFNAEAMRTQRINGMLGTLEQMQQNAQAQAHPLAGLGDFVDNSRRWTRDTAGNVVDTLNNVTQQAAPSQQADVQRMNSGIGAFGGVLNNANENQNSGLKGISDSISNWFSDQFDSSKNPNATPDTGNDPDVIDAASTIANPPKQDAAPVKPEEMAKQVVKNSRPALEPTQGSSKVQTTVSARQRVANIDKPVTAPAQPATNGKPQTGTVDQLDQQLDPAQPAAAQQPAKPADQEFKWSSLVTDPRFLQTIAAFGNALSSGQNYGQAAYTGMEKGIAVGKEQAALAAAAEEKAYKRMQDQIANRRENKKVNIDVYKAETDRLNSESTTKLNEFKQKALLSGINVDNAQIAQLRASANKLNAETAMAKAGGKAKLDTAYGDLYAKVATNMAGSTQEEIMAATNGLIAEEGRRYLTPPPEVVTKMREYATKGIPADVDKNEAIKEIQRNHMIYGYNY